MTIARATLWSILGAYLLLPSGTEVDLPMVPPMDKYTVSNLAAFLVCRFVLGKRIALLPRERWLRGLILVYLISPFITTMLNPDPIFAGPTVIKGMEYYDALSAVIRQTLFILPFLLGFTFLRDARSHEDILHVLVIAGLVYSLPSLLEVRLSPQLHAWIYGYFPHSFIQQMRGGGFRPVVFLGHGLLVAFFFTSAFFSASVFWKMRKSVLGVNAAAITAYLAVVLILCKSMASFLYAVVLFLVSRFSLPKTQVRFAKILAIVVVIYPMLRATDFFPVQELEEMAAEISKERAQSLQYRFDNEELLLKHAREQAFFGWGSWGRNRVYHPVTGKDLTVTDGRWIIVMGEYGWVGYLAEFGLLVLPILRSAKIISKIPDKRERGILATLNLLMAFSIFDLLPNASVAPWTWLLAGALVGRSEQLRNALREQKIPKNKSSTSASSVSGMQSCPTL
ncbi:hypothetical protein [Methylomonas sp. MgM2]